MTANEIGVSAPAIVLSCFGARADRTEVKFGGGLIGLALSVGYTDGPSPSRGPNTVRQLNLSIARIIDRQS
jgi:hypothetical protein